MTTGTLHADGDSFTVRFERNLPAPPGRVWQALTDEADLVTWFPVAFEGEWSKGAGLRLVFRHDEGPTLDGEILEADEPRLLAFRWGEEALRFELVPSDEGCCLTFVNIFGDGGRAARTAAGWHLCLDALEAQLSGAAPEPRSERWEGVYAAYVERFGTEYATAPVPDRG